MPRSAGDLQRDPPCPIVVRSSSSGMPRLHPSSVAVDHTVEDLGIAWLEAGGDADRIARWTQDADLPVRVVDADEGARALGIATPDGEIVFR